MQRVFPKGGFSPAGSTLRLRGVDDLFQEGDHVDGESSPLPGLACQPVQRIEPEVVPRSVEFSYVLPARGFLRPVGILLSVRERGTACPSVLDFPCTRALPIAP